MTPLGIDQVADIGWGALFRGEGLVMFIAVTGAESGWDPAQVGDESRVGERTPDGRTWGPSIGIGQVRSIQEERGTGRDRDEDALRGSPARQAQAVYNISGGGGNWSQWSTFGNGAYRRFYAQAEQAAARRAVAGGSGAIAGGGTPIATPFPTGATSDVFGVPGGELAPNYTPPRHVSGIVLYDEDRTRDLSPWVLDGHVDLTTEEVSEIALTVHGAAFDGREPLVAGTGMEWGDLRLVAAAVETVQGPGGLHVAVAARSAGAHRMKHPLGGPSAVGVKNMSATEYAEQIATGVGRLRFHGQGTHRRADITPVTDQAGVAETTWAVIQRLAQEEGFLAFEAAGVFYFGRPSWLADSAVEVKVGWAGGWGDPALDALEIPHIRDSVDTLDGATVELLLPRWRGEQVRPGMAVVLRGLKAADVHGRFLVTQVGWDVDAGTGPVTVAGREPVDPVVQAGLDLSGGGGANGEPPDGPVTPGSGSALDLVTLCLQQIGDRYVWGAEADPNDQDPKTFDCSELVQWAAGRVGVPFTDGTWLQYRAIRDARLDVSVDVAGRTRGALLFKFSSNPLVGGRPSSAHVAVSLGDSATTVEAQNPAKGVVQGNFAGRGWTHAGLIPGLDYGRGRTLPRVA